MKWLQAPARGQQLGVRPGDLAADPAVDDQRCDVPASRAAARPAGGHPAAGPGAVHEPQVVALDGTPAAATDRTAAAGRGGLGLADGRSDRRGRLGNRLEDRPRGSRHRCARRAPSRDVDLGDDGRAIGQRGRRLEDQDRAGLGPADRALDLLATDLDRERLGRRGPVHRLREADRDGRVAWRVGRGFLGAETDDGRRVGGLQRDRHGRQGDPVPVDHARDGQAIRPARGQRLGWLERVLHRAVRHPGDLQRARDGRVELDRVRDRGRINRLAKREVEARVDRDPAADRIRRTRGCRSSRRASGTRHVRVAQAAGRYRPGRPLARTPCSTRPATSAPVARS